MKNLGGVAGRLIDGFGSVSVVGIGFMALLTCADVIMRLFGHPIPGTYELMGFLGSVVVGFALAKSTKDGYHVAVEILVLRLAKGTQKTIYVITHIVSFLFFAVVSLGCVRYGNDLRNTGEVSMTLEIPIFPFLYCVALAMGLTSVVLLWGMWDVIVGKKEPWS